MIWLFNDCPETESWSSPCWRLLGEVLLVGQALLKDPPALKTWKFVKMISFFDETFWERLILIQRGIHLYWLFSSLNSEFFVKVWQFLKCFKWWLLFTLGAVHALCQPNLGANKPLSLAMVSTCLSHPFVIQGGLYPRKWSLNTKIDEYPLKLTPTHPKKKKSDLKYF